MVVVICFFPFLTHRQPQQQSAKIAFTVVAPLFGGTIVHNYVSAAAGVHVFLAAGLSAYFGGTLAIYSARQCIVIGATTTFSRDNRRPSIASTLGFSKGFSVGLALCGLVTLALSVCALLVPVVEFRMTGAAALLLQSMGPNPGAALVRQLSLWDVCLITGQDILEIWGMAGPLVGVIVNWVLGIAFVMAAPLASCLLLVAFHRAPTLLVTLVEVLRLYNGLLVWIASLVSAYVGTELLGAFIIGSKCDVINELFVRYPSIFGADINSCATMSAHPVWGIYLLCAAYAACMAFSTLSLLLARIILYPPASEEDSPIWMRVLAGAGLMKSSSSASTYELVINHESDAW